MAENEPESKERNPWAQAGLAMAIPSLLMAGPITGYLLGLGIIRVFELSDPWATRTKYICLILGLMAGIRETYKIIRKITSQGSK